MNQDDVFFLNKENIEIEGMNAMVRFTRYDPDHPELFLENIELSEDLTNKFGTILYAKNTPITPQRIARLIQLRESNPNLDFLFRIRQSAKLIQKFREDIKEQIFEIYKRRQKANGFRELLSNIDENIESFIDEMLSENNITLALYQIRFICGSLNKNIKNKCALFLEHSLNVALISLAIATSKQYTHNIGKDRGKLIEICKSALLHNYGALSNIKVILDFPPDKIFEQYWDANLNGFLPLGNFKLGLNVIESIRFICKYYTMWNKDFVNSEEWPATIANIVLVADAFLQRESGLFDEPLTIKKALDQLNVRVAEKKLNGLAVQALTLGLQMKDIFDFYKELEDLGNKCLYNKSGFPYPLKGFRSATLFICKNSVMRCKYIDVSAYAVNLLQPLGDLKPGKYYRCLLLTPKLISFYKKHYMQIKDTTMYQKDPTSD